jgi:hypothetical protein
MKRHVVIVVIELYSRDATVLDQIGSQLESIHLHSTVAAGSGEHTLPKNVFAGETRAPDADAAIANLRHQVQSILEGMNIGETDCKILYLASDSLAIDLSKD